MQRKFLLTFIALLSLFSFNYAVASPLLAQVKLDPQLKPEYATNFTNIGDQSAASYGNYVLQLVAGSLIYIAGPLAVLMIAFGGWSYVNARGDQNKLEEAKKTIMWAALGLAAIIISYSVVSNVINIILGTVPKSDSSVTYTPPSSQQTNSNNQNLDPNIDQDRGSTKSLNQMAPPASDSSPNQLDENRK